MTKRLTSRKWQIAFAAAATLAVGAAVAQNAAPVPDTLKQQEAAPSAAAQRGGGGAEGQTMAAIDAKRRFDAAMAFVGPGLSDILWRVACEGDGLAVAEKGLGWPTRAGKLVLGLALDRLVAHYEYQYGILSVDNRDDME